MQEHNYLPARQLDSFETIIFWDAFLGLTPTASTKRKQTYWRIQV